MNIKGLGSQWVATGYVGLISMLLTFLYGRLLGPENFGEFSYFLTLGAIFSILQDGGFRTLVYRESTLSSYDEAADKIFLMSLSHVVIVTLVGVIFTLIIPFENQVLVLLVLTAYGLGTLTVFVSSRLKGEGEFEKDASWKILTRTLTAGFIIIFIFLISSKMKWILIGWIVGNMVSLLFRFNLWSIKFKIPEWNKKVYTSIVSLIVIDLATIIYFKVDIVMLKGLGLESGQIGFYAAASRLLEGLIFIHVPVATYFFRYLRLYSKEKKSFLKLFNRLLIFSLISPIAIVSVGFIFSESLFELCYGSKFVKGHGVFGSLLLALFFMIPNLVFTQALLALNREKDYACVACLCAILNISLNYYLIPEYGSMGAVVGTIVTEGFLLLGIGGVFYYLIYSKSFKQWTNI